MERVERKLELNLNKKQSELKMALKINSRLKDDAKRVRVHLCRNKLWRIIYKM